MSSYMRGYLDGCNPNQEYDDTNAIDKAEYAKGFNAGRAARRDGQCLNNTA